jgi:hypothetical protein
MTNAPNYQSQPPRGGMPKWLIVLLVIFLVICVGCCGGFVMCSYLLKKVGDAAPGFIADQAKKAGLAVNELPGNFPSDVSVQPGFHPLGGMGKPGTDSGFATVSGPDPVAGAMGYYDKQLTGQGWTQESSSDNNGTATATYTKGDRKVHVSATHPEKETLVTIVWEKKGEESVKPEDAGGAIPAVPAGPEAPAPDAPAATPAPGPRAQGGGGRSGLTNGATTRLPRNFPADVPVYEGLKPTFQLSDNVKGNGSVSFAGPAGVDKITGFYEKEMEKKGWKLESNQSINDGSMYQYTKDGMKVQMSMVPDGDKTLVVIAYEKLQQ